MTSKFVITGAGGFLGWHTRAALRAQGIETASMSLGSAFDERAAMSAAQGAERVIHLAGVNRASDEDILDGNICFADQLARTLRHVERPPRTVVYANSTQSGNGTAYGTAKARAGEILADAATSIGAEFIDVPLPNLFGEHGRPFYNAVTATFCHILAEGGTPEVTDDKELTLLHAQNAVDLLTGHVPVARLSDLVVRETVSSLRDQLAEQSRVYRSGEIPDVASNFSRDLFNTYRSYTFPAHAPIKLTRHADARGSFFEIIRSHGGDGQASFSTTVPGVTRGDHFHRRKIERFTVLSGKATISLRRLFFDEVVSFKVDGDAPVAVDMPTMWTHNIVNMGDDLLYTSFWTNDIFDPENPDTNAEVV